MAPEERQPHSPVRDSLFEEFYEFSFYRAVHLLEWLFPEKKPLGEALAPGQEPVRFTVKPGFAFPPSDLSALRPPTEASEPPNMEVAFLGLIGPSGVLPHWYNELAVERIRQKDHSLAAFLDVFHHRLITLFYLAWKKHRFPENYRFGARDRLSHHMLSLLGLGTPGLLERIGLQPESLIFYGGLLSRAAPSTAAIEATVQYFAEAAVQVAQFIDRLIPVAPEEQTRLGMANARLGEDAACGSLAWESQTKFRVRIGPVGYDHFVRLMPSGNLLKSVFSIVRFMVGIEYEFEVGVVLKRAEVPPCILGKTDPKAPRLGWSTWAKSAGETHRKDPMVVFQEPQGRG
jgi:type VI secretion system protein ImpH